MASCRDRACSSFAKARRSAARPHSFSQARAVTRIGRSGPRPAWIPTVMSPSRARRTAPRQPKGTRHAPPRTLKPAPPWHRPRRCGLLLEQFRDARGSRESRGRRRVPGRDVRPRWPVRHADSGLDPDQAGRLDDVHAGRPLLVFRPQGDSEQAAHLFCVRRLLLQRAALRRRSAELRAAGERGYEGARQHVGHRRPQSARQPVQGLVLGLRSRVHSRLRVGQQRGQLPGHGGLAGHHRPSQRIRERHGGTELDLRELQVSRNDLRVRKQRRGRRGPHALLLPPPALRERQELGVAGRFVLRCRRGSVSHDGHQQLEGFRESAHVDSSDRERKPVADDLGFFRGRGSRNTIRRAPPRSSGRPTIFWSPSRTRSGAGKSPTGTTRWRLISRMSAARCPTFDTWWRKARTTSS